MKKRPANIIKGTPSSKGTKEEIQSLIDSLKVKTAPSPSTTIPSLFPPGVKTPLGLLNERCQKLGFNSPSVTTRQLPSGKWTGSVTLSRLNPKKEREAVRMSPPSDSEISVEMNTALEAKHWSAMYALYRFSNNLQLKLQLPPSTRPYWSALEAEKAASPKNKQWLWSTTPFETAIEGKNWTAPVDASIYGNPGNGIASSTSASMSSTPASIRSTPTTSRASTPSLPMPKISIDKWLKAPEVRMASHLRSLVEDTVSRSMMILGEVENQGDDEELSEMDLAMISELEGQGFRVGHIKSAIQYVNGSPSSSNGHKFSLVEQYLLLSIAEEDLPPHYRLSKPADANARISTALNSEELAFNWRCESMSKTTGFPISFVVKAMNMISGSKAHIGLANDLLLRRLMGWVETDSIMSDWEVLQSCQEEVIISEELKQRREDEVMGLEGIFGDRFRVTEAGGLEILISDLEGGVGKGGKRKDQVVLRVFYHTKSSYPSPPTDAGFLHLPTFYIYSSTLPTYIRLHLNSLVQAQMLTDELQELLLTGEGGLIIEIVNYLIEVHEAVIGSPPTPKSVLAKLSGFKLITKGEINSKSSTKKSINKSFTKKLKRDSRIDSELKQKMELNYNKLDFKKMETIRNKLPASKMKQELIDLIKTNRVVIVAGETGSGKTTQVPSFVLDDLILSGLGSITNMIVTQPRRVSAIGVATRVAQERLEVIGNETSRDLVGYAIRGERKAGRDCKLLFCTTGVVLARLTRGGDGNLEDVSHIFIDEVHERSVDSDFLLLELRDILTRNPKIKVILMSATINQEQFSNYFGGAPCITIAGFAHPVKDFYLEDILPLLPSNFQPTSNKPVKKANQAQLEAMRQTFIDRGVSPNDERVLQQLENITRAEKIDYQLLAAVTAYCLTKDSVAGEGDVLVFMTGVQEITQAIQAIKQAIPSSIRYEIFPLHANLSSQEQVSVFNTLRPGVRKIVVSTNVAETSITIDGISFVIDSGRVKENTFSPETSMVKLEEQWTSRASAKQRRGRAGRTRPGECFKLFTIYTEENFMNPHPTPEMVRIPLEMLILMLKSIKLDVDVKLHLGKALSPPDVRAIDSAWNTLLLLGAVENDGPLLTYSARLTPLGKHLSMIPVDLRLGKMLILGSIFSALSPILTIVALLSSKPLFLNSMDKRDEIKKTRSSFYTGKSDLLSDLKAFDGLIQARSNGGNGEMKRYAEENFISLSTFRDVMNLRGEYMTALSEVGFVPFRSNIENETLNRNSDQENLLKAIIYAGTGRLVQVKVPTAKFDQGSSGALQREQLSKEVKFYESGLDGRVFIHPGSLLFSENKYPTPFLTYFSKHVTTKPFLRDATSIPFYAILLFGPKIQIDLQRGLIVGEHLFRAWPRIGVLVSELRRIFDAELESNFDSPNWGGDFSDCIKSMLALLEKDGSGA